MSVPQRGLAIVRAPDATAAVLDEVRQQAPPLQQLIQAAVGLRPGEYAQTGAFLAYLMLASAIFIGGRTVRDTLFLSRMGVEMLPWMLVLYGVVSMFVAATYSRVADRFRRDRLIVGTCVLAALSYAGAWLAVKRDWTPIYPIFYVWAEVVGVVFVSQFWALANDFHSPRTAKRLFGLIGTGRVLGIVVCGLSISALARLIGAENIILLLILMMGAVILFVARIRARFTPANPLEPRQAPRGLSHPVEQTTGPALSSQYAKLLAATVFATFLVAQIADYQFKATARANYSGDALAAFLGQFYAVVGGVAIFLQLFVTGRVLARFGLQPALLVMPTAMLLSSIGFALWPGVPTAFLLKFSDNAFQFSINEAAVQLLYFPFPAAAKGRIRAVIDTSVNPAAFATAGVILLLWAKRLSLPALDIFTVPLAVIWTGLVVRLCGQYVGALASTLRDRALRFGHQEDMAEDLLSRQSLVELIGDQDRETALYALEHIRRSAPDAIAPHVGRLLASPHEPVEIATLQILEEHPIPFAQKAVENCLRQARSPRVRAAAIRAYCALRGEEALEDVLPFLSSENERLRISVMAGVMKHCGLDGVLACGPDLQDMLVSDDANDRVMAAKVLGQIGVRHFYRQLMPLLEDAAPEVRLEAARAARAVLNPKLIPLLARMIGPDDPGQAAAKALTAFGDPAVPALQTILASPSATREAGRVAVKALRRIGTLRALKTLVAHIDHRDDRLRRRILRAIVRLHRDLGRPKLVQPEDVRKRLGDELRRAYQILSSGQGVLRKYPGQVLRDTIAQDVARSADRVWSLLSLLADPGLIGRCRRGIEYGTPAERSNALEVLDNTLEDPAKTAFITLLETHSGEEMLATGGRFFELEQVTPEGWLITYLQSDGGGWHRAVAVDTVGLHRIRPLVDYVAQAMDDRVVLVRELALWALVRTLGDEARELVRKVDSDRELMAHRTSRWIRDLFFDPEAAQRNTGGRILLTTLEEVIFMRHIPLFQGVASEHLAALAELTEEVFAAPGQEIVRQGEPGDSLFLIVSGKVEVLVDGQRVGVLGPKECFGEMALLDGETRSATVRALESTDMLTLGHDEFHEFLEERSEVGSNVLRVLSRRIRTLNQKLVEVRSKPPEPPKAAGAE